MTAHSSTALRNIYNNVMYIENNKNTYTNIIADI